MTHNHTSASGGETTDGTGDVPGLSRARSGAAAQLCDCPGQSVISDGPSVGRGGGAAPVHGEVDRWALAEAIAAAIGDALDIVDDALASRGGTAQTVSAEQVEALLDRYYDDEWGTFGEDGWRFVRDLRTALGDTDLTMQHPVCEVCWLTHPEGACDR